MSSPAQIIRTTRDTAEMMINDPGAFGEPQKSNGTVCKAHLMYAVHWFNTTTGLEANTIAISFNSSGEMTKVKFVHEAV